MDKEHIAFERLRQGALMSEKYYEKPLMITYSGGKDSDVIVNLAIHSGINFEVVNSHTTADAPETVYYIRKKFKEWEANGIKCTIEYPTYNGKPISMWSLIPIKKMPPTRIVRYCCNILKETSGDGRAIATGVRWAESIKRKNDRGIYEDNGKHYSLFSTGKVIGEFVCDNIVPISVYYSNPNGFKARAFELPCTCLTDKEIIDYLGNGKSGYGWHISDLKIYDKPKELSEFRKPILCHRGQLKEKCIGCYDCEITRPPQSWIYVEELED